MQPIIAAMLKVRQAFYAAIIRSLLRTKSLIQTILNLWVSPSVLNGKNVDEASGLLKAKREEFLEDVKLSFQELKEGKLVKLSNGLKKQFKESLLDNPISMQPSYNHQLPTGDEVGTFLALDVGGSTFRVALIELAGRKNEGPACRVLNCKSIKISSAIKQLRGVLFFDWMAARIEDTLSGQINGQEMSHSPLSMGLSWSFPIEQTSLRSGRLQSMGKNFLAAQDLLGQDLGDLIQDACSRRGLNVQLNAIVNDSSATLLSKAYQDPTTRFGLILGTGLNAAVHLPVHIFSPSKFGVRPSSWHDSAKHVIVNTELSTFGGGLLSFTKYDKQLLSNHPLPDFQPLEYLVSGGYLGEIVRLALVDGIQNAGLFGGVLPPNLRERYSLETETLSLMESDCSPGLSSALKIFTSRHPSSHTPTLSDIKSLCLIASYVAQRASSIVAVGVHALWELRNEAENILPNAREHTVVAYNGSVLEQYPNFQTSCQRKLDELVEASGGKAGLVELMHAAESSLIGAAVAVSCVEG